MRHRAYCSPKVPSLDRRTISGTRGNASTGGRRKGADQNTHTSYSALSRELGTGLIHCGNPGNGPVHEKSKVMKAPCYEKAQACVHRRRTPTQSHKTQDFCPQVYSLPYIGVCGGRSNHNLEPAPLDIQRNNSRSRRLPIALKMIKAISHDQGTVKVCPRLPRVEVPRSTNRQGFYLFYRDTLDESSIPIKGNRICSEGIGGYVGSVYRFSRHSHATYQDHQGHNHK
jgi:hypothetical protein